MLVGVNKVSLCYDDTKYKYDVADIEEMAWEVIAQGMMYNLVKNETGYSLFKCDVETYVKFRAPKEKESKDSMVAEVKVSVRTPGKQFIERIESFDARKIEEKLPYKYYWGNKIRPKDEDIEDFAV